MSDTSDTGIPEDDSDILGSEGDLGKSVGLLTFDDEPTFSLSPDFIRNLGIDTSAYGIIDEHPEMFAPRAKYVTIPVGLQDHMAIRGSINGGDIASFLRVESCNLSRLSAVRHTLPTGRHSWFLTGMFRDVILDLWIVAETDKGPKRIPLWMYLYTLSADVSRSRNRPPLDVNTWLQSITSCGLNPRGPMVMRWQHMGVPAEKMLEIEAWCQENGGQEAMDDVRKNDNDRIVWAYRWRAGGFPVTRFSVGAQDRLQSKIAKAGLGKGQGFIDFIDAMHDNYDRIMRVAQQAHDMKTDAKARREALEVRLQGKSATTEADRREAAEINRIVERANKLLDTLRSGSNNYGGIAQRWEVAEDLSGAKPLEVWDAVSVPIGEFEITLPSGDPYHFDLWPPRNQQGEAVEVVMDPSEVPQGEDPPSLRSEEPF
jgi:hypothetical protein